MAVIVNGDGILTGVSSLTTALDDITSGRGTITGVTTVGTLQLGTGVSISSPRSQQAAIFTNNTEFLTVDDAGRVGLAITNPTTKFDVNGTSKFQDDVTFTGASANITFDKSTDDLIFDDNAQAKFGTSGDLSIFHDGTNSILYNNTGQLALRGNDIQLTAKNTEKYFVGTLSGAVELYYNNGKKLETTNLGIEITGTTNSKLAAANGTLVLESTNNDVLVEASDDFIVRVQSSETAINAIGDGAVELYHNGSKKIETTSTGVTISGSDTTGSIVQGDFRLKTASGTQHIVYDASNSRMNFADIAKVTFGDANDLKIYHDGSGSYIDNETGALRVRDTGGVTKISVYGSGTIFSNTTDNAAMNDCILLTRRGYEFSGLGTKIQAMGGSIDSQNGIQFAHSHSNGGGYTVRQRLDHDGIKFNGDTATANALDDYEEGTWTPTFDGWSNISYSGSPRNAEYVKVGNLVYIRGFLSGTSTGSNSGNLKIGNLPFTPNSGGYGRHACSVQGGSFALSSGEAGLFGLIEESVNRIDVYGGNTQGINVGINATKWNGSGIYFAGCYHILGY